MKFVNPKDFILTEIPNQHQFKLVGAVRKAYEDSIKIITLTKELNWLGGKQILPHIRRALIEYEVQVLCKNSIIPFDFRMAPNKIDNCYHLEVKTSNSTLTFSYVQNKKCLPRKAIFRKDLSIFNNQISIFDQDYELSGPYHLIITHGGQGLVPDFIYIGMPDSEKRVWKENLNITYQLQNIIDKVKENKDDIVEINDDIGLGLKKEYLKKRGVLS
jgi:hypothetical protein